MKASPVLDTSDPDSPPSSFSSSSSPKARFNSLRSESSSSELTDDLRLLQQKAITFENIAVGIFWHLFDVIPLFKSTIFVRE